MPASFDPYYKWLGIPPRDQPPHHYRLLGIELFESDSDVIEAAANRLMAYLQDLSTGDEVEHAQRLLNEVAAARRCLLNAEKRGAYDTTLQASRMAKAGPDASGAPGGSSRLERPIPQPAARAPTQVSQPKTQPLNTPAAKAQAAPPTGQASPAAPVTTVAPAKTSPPSGDAGRRVSQSRPGADAGRAPQSQALVTSSTAATVPQPLFTAAVAPKAARAKPAARRPRSVPWLAAGVVAAGILIAFVAAAVYSLRRPAALSSSTIASPPQLLNRPPAGGRGEAKLSTATIGESASTKTRDSHDKPLGRLQVVWPESERAGGRIKVGRRKAVSAEERVEFQLTEGKHTIIIEREGYQSIRETILVRPNETTEFRPTWVALATSQPLDSAAASTAAAGSSVPGPEASRPSDAAANRGLPPLIEPEADAAAADLPPRADEGEVVILRDLPEDPAGLELGLLGGEAVLESTILRLERDSSGRRWSVVSESGSAGSRPVAALVLEAGQLRFRWVDGAKSPPQVEQLRNCILVVGSADHGSRSVPLRRPKRFDPIPVLRAAGGSIQSLELDALPDPKLLRMEITRVEGPDPFRSLLDGAFARHDGGARIELTRDPARPAIEADVEWRVANGGKQLVVEARPRFAKLAAKGHAPSEVRLKELEQRLEQQEKRLAGPARRKNVAPADQDRELAEWLRSMIELHRHPDQVRFHFRLYAEFARQRIMLAETEAFETKELAARETWIPVPVLVTPPHGDRADTQQVEVEWHFRAVEDASAIRIDLAPAPTSGRRGDAVTIRHVALQCGRQSVALDKPWTGSPDPDSGKEGWTLRADDPGKPQFVAFRLVDAIEQQGTTGPVLKLRLTISAPDHSALRRLQISYTSSANPRRLDGASGKRNPN